MKKALLLITLFTSSLFIHGVAKAQLAVPNEKGLTYGHVHVNVSDMELHKQIWTEYFGGVVVQKGFLTAIRLPNMLVALTEAEPTMGSRQTIMDHFGFKVRDIDAFMAKWRESGYEYGEYFTGAEGQTNAYVTLPDGVYVELQEDQSLHVPVMGYHVHFRTAMYEE
ncbi:MAG: VOC family protein [Gammaproteobacteria bacterium]